MSSSKRYQAALDYLYSYIDYSLTRAERYSPERFSLSRVHELMDALGKPSERYPTLHVAGTKGKGSVSALCASALQAEDLSVGLYTSPHGIEFTERFQINGKPIHPDQLVDHVDELMPIVEDIAELTTFEIGTALAFQYFAAQNVDVAVIEVGLGGRLDATNVITPLVSVITSISYDHTKFLGESLQEIATEKAGIIKPGVPVVVSPQQDEALTAIQKISKRQKAPLIQVGRDTLYAPLSRSLEGQTLLLWSAKEQPLADAYIESGGATEDWEPMRLRIPLLGAHQVQNAATAYTSLITARHRGLQISLPAIQRGFANVRWPARFEILGKHPPVVVDAAHNRDSALKLRLALDDYFPGLPVILIFGASADKDIRGMFSELMPRVRQVIATRSTHPRAIETQALVDMAHQFGRPATAVPAVEEALPAALALAESEAVVLATGSLFVATGIREAWNQREHQPPPAKTGATGN